MARWRRGRCGPGRKEPKLVRLLDVRQRFGARSIGEIDAQSSPSARAAATHEESDLEGRLPPACGERRAVEMECAHPHAIGDRRARD